MAGKVKNLIRAVAFMLVFGVVFLAVQEVVVPKRDWPASERRMTKAFRSFYREPKNSLDFICVGSSFVFSGISPMDMYRQTGIRGYVLAGPGQRAGIGYQLIKSAMGRQDPKLVIVDIGSLFKPEENNTNKASWQGSLDSLPVSHVADRVEMASELARARGESFDEDYLKRSVLPLMQYHTNYLADRDAYLDLHVDQVYHRKGYAARSQIVPSTEMPVGLAEPGEDDDDVNDDANDDELEEAAAYNRVYYEKIMELCRDNDCELLLMKVPVNAGENYASNWNPQRHDLAQKLADELGVRFLDLNYEDIGLDWSMDTPDGGQHLNLYGARKVSAYLADWIKSNMAISGTGDEKLDAQWDYQLKLFDWEMQFYDLQLLMDLPTYLRQAKAGNNTIFVSVSGGVGDYWSDEAQAAFSEALGTGFDLRQNRAAGYVAMASGGSLLSENSGEGSAKLSGYLEDGTKYRVVSNSEGGTGKITINRKDVDCDGRGLRVVVYNNDLRCVVDSVTFNTAEEACGALRGNKDYVDDFHIQLIDYAYRTLKKM